MLGEQLSEGGEAFEGAGSDELGEATHADVVGALVGGLVGVVVDLVEVANGDGVDRAAVAPGCLVTTPKQRKRKVVPWSSEEARRFLESARADQDVMYAAFVLILVLGLRKGEVLGLRWGAVDLAGRELVIDHQVQRVRRELLYRETKTDASDATLPMPEIVATGW